MQNQTDVITSPLGRILAVLQFLLLFEGVDSIPLSTWHKGIPGRITPSLSCVDSTTILVKTLKAPCII